MMKELDCCEIMIVFGGIESDEGWRVLHAISVACAIGGVAAQLVAAFFMGDIPVREIHKKDIIRRQATILTVAILIAYASFTSEMTL